MTSTPGPWHIAKRPRFEAQIRITDGTGFPVAVIPAIQVDSGTVEYFEKTRRANARLIVAAHDLLEALAHCTNVLRDEAEGAGDVPAWNKGGRNFEALKAATLALAKVESEEAFERVSKAYATSDEEEGEGTE